MLRLNNHFFSNLARKKACPDVFVPPVTMPLPWSPSKMFPGLVAFSTLDGIRDAYFCCCWFQTASEADGQLQTRHSITKSAQGTIRPVPPVTNVFLTCFGLLRSLEPKILSSLILLFQFHEWALIGCFGLHNGWYNSTFVPPVTVPPVTNTCVTGGTSLVFQPTFFYQRIHVWMY